jgi:quinol monooxygenase YgiN
MEGMSIFVRARFDVHDGRQSDFEEVVRTLCALAENETGTRTYRFFSAGPGSYLVLEEYVDPAAALLHNERAAELLARVQDCADMVYVELYGPIGPELEEWVRTQPTATAFPAFTATAG